MTAETAAERLQREIDGETGNIHTFKPRAEGAGERAEAKRSLSTIWADDIELKIAQGGVIDEVLPHAGFGVLYGESGAGKTFAAIDMACHVAAGRTWRSKPVEQGVVIYVAAESPESVKRRLWAWKQHHSVEHLPVLVVQSGVDLLNVSTAQMVELVKTTTTEKGRVAMVVVDTLARAMTGNENAPDDMGRFVDAGARIREAGAAVVMVVHHTGKDTAKGARGHSSLRAASDFELEVTEGCIKVTKSRDDAGGWRFGFRLQGVELGTNNKGRVVTTCVAVEADAPTKSTKKRKLGPNEVVVLQCLATAIVDHGQPPPGGSGFPHAACSCVVTREVWHDVATRHLTQGKPWHRDQAFDRSLESLTADFFVRHQDGLYWLPDAATHDTHGHA